MQSSEQFDQRQLETVRRLESPFAALTLTRSATLAIVTTGTTITWQTQTRGIGITWATTDITIPTSGFYLLSLSLQFSTNVSGNTNINVNGTVIGNFILYSTATTRHYGTLLRYFSTGDSIRFVIFPSANTTLNVAAEGTSQESPILHITQLTAAIP